MLTATVIRKKSGGFADYFSDDFNPDKRIEKYYVNASEIIPRWSGKIATQLGIQGKETTIEDLEKLLTGYLPNGERFVTRMKKDRRCGFDIVSACPKSVSIQSQFDPRIREIFRRADEVAFQQLEERTKSRLRADGQNADLTTGNFLKCTIEHSENRSGDFHLHRHHIIPSLTWDGKVFKSIQPIAFYERMRFFTEVFRNEMARGLREAGYEIRNTKAGMEIEGISDEIISRYCGTKDRIDAAAEKVEKRLGRKLNNDERANIAHDVKSEKKSIGEIEFVRRNLAKLSLEEQARLKALVKDAPAPVDTSSAQAAADAVNHSIESVFERTVGAKTFQVGEIALKAVRGYATFEQVKARFNKAGLIRDTDLCTTDFHVKLEQRIIKYANDSAGKFQPLATFQPVKGLSAEQAKMVQQCLESTGLTLISGSPGTGKSFALKSLLSQIPDSVTVAVLAPTNSAVDVLVQDGIQAQTLAKFLHSTKRPAVVICDEASLIGSKDFAALLDKIGPDTRLILQGDENQAKSVAAGSPFAVLLQHSKATRAELRKIIRQKNPGYRESVQLMASGRFEAGCELLNSLGCVEEIEDADSRRKRAAEIYIEMAQKGTVCAVAHSWKEIDSTTSQIRELLKSKGILKGAETAVETVRTVDMTTAQKSREKSWDKRWLVQVIKPVRSLAKGVCGQFLGVSLGDVVMRFQGVIHRLKPEHVQAVEPRTVELCEGEKILLQENGKDPDGKKLIRGKIEQVTKLENGLIKTASGKIIDTNKFKNFTHGYVLTSHAAQGHTADRALVMQEKTMGKKGFYVSVSRGKEEVKVLTEEIILPRDDGLLMATNIYESARNNSKQCKTEQHVSTTGFTPTSFRERERRNRRGFHGHGSDEPGRLAIPNNNGGFRPTEKTVHRERD